MPINQFSIGKDFTLSIALPTGALRLEGLTGFKSKQDTTDVRSKQLSGKTKHVMFPDSWSGTIMLDRRNQTLDAYISAREANYYNSIYEAPVSMMTTIQESDGSISQFRYTGVQLKLSDAGEWRGDALVKMTIDFVAEERKQA